MVPTPCSAATPPSVSFTSGALSQVSVASGESEAIVIIENITDALGGDAIVATGDIVAHRFAGLAGDSLLGELGADTLLGGTGNDTLARGAADDSLSGDAGDGSLLGGLDSDTLAGGAGADTIRAGAGPESIDGGADVDTLDYAAGSVGVTIAFAGQGEGSVSTPAGLTGFSNIETLIGFLATDFLRPNGSQVVSGDWSVSERRSQVNHLSPVLAE